MGVDLMSRVENCTGSPMVLEMIDWRGCPVVEYVPERMSGDPSFVNCRVKVSQLVDWVNRGYSVDEFANTYYMDVDLLRVAVRYLRDSPPVEIVDLAGCPGVELNRWGEPSFAGSGIRVEALFNFLKAGRSASEFAATYEWAGIDDGHVTTVLAHARH